MRKSILTIVLVSFSAIGNNINDSILWNNTCKEMTFKKGDTKPIKEQLKELGGKFNFRLSCGAGWIFQKSKLEEVQKLLQGEKPTTLHDEVEETINFLAELDVKMYGEVSESVKECARVQEVEIHHEAIQATPNNTQLTFFL